jgi:hypothetical protein
MLFLKTDFSGGTTGTLGPLSFLSAFRLVSAFPNHANGFPHFRNRNVVSGDERRDNRGGCLKYFIFHC